MVNREFNQSSPSSQGLYDRVEAGVAQRELNGPALENAELKARVAELEAKLAATVKKGSDAL